MSALKYSLTIVCVLLVLTVIIGVGYKHAVSEAGADKAGGEQLQQSQEQPAYLQGQSKAEVDEKNVRTKRAALVERNAFLAVTPSIWPAYGEVTSRFGWRKAPFGGDGNEWHPGLDIAANYGTPIVATADGQVIFSGWYGGYGNMVQIDHGRGIVSIYGHCSQTIAKIGTNVKKGSVIAYMGSTGSSTGVHVHYEIRVNEIAVNPESYL
jgi:murein DD-endopeptidase MepM/ murein hydrolase activator NlpD